jgi:hypothetical protein
MLHSPSPWAAAVFTQEIDIFYPLYSAIPWLVFVPSGAKFRIAAGMLTLWPCQQNPVL